MKELKLTLLAVVMAGAAMLVGCDNPEKMKDVPQDAFPKMDPNPMVLQGKTVSGKITGKFPPKYFNKNAKLELIPVVTYGGSELKLSSKTYQGEKITENNPVINYENGGSFSIDYSFPYKEEMMQSEMELRYVLLYKEKQVPFDVPLKLGYGINVTQLLVDREAEPVLMGNNFTRDHLTTKEAQIGFAIQSSDVRSGELTKDDVKALQDAIKDLSANQKAELKGIDVYAYASPDGPVDLNDKLSRDRGSNTQKWMSQTLKKGKVDADLVSVKERATDWDGFRTMVQGSDIEDKEMILRVLEMYSDPDTRNREMHNLGKVFSVLAEQILPKLRRSRMVANIAVKGYTDEELVEMVNGNRVSELGLEEGLYAATLVQDFMKKADVYANLASRFTTDVRPLNNLAYVYLKQNRLEDAKTNLDKAAALESENPFVLNNLGVYEMGKNNDAEAEKYFSRATAAGEVVKSNLGICEILKGNYNKARDYMVGVTSFNAGLARMLSGELDAAKNTFSAVKSAKSYYGLAIVGARNSDEKMIVSNLKEAFSMDGSLKERAKKDVEFVKFAQSAAVSALF
ncbi:MAG: hypothetical protein HG459_003190 [Bacteroidia bacterium]|jgi:hypothetical protein|nr:hypothetical protein [Bacteroidia bacterium]